MANIKVGSININRPIVGLLGFGLLLILAYYLYSHYQSHILTNKVTPPHLVEQPSKIQAPVVENSTDVQPDPSTLDKALPAPAHQLKKVIAQPEVIDDAQLQSKLNTINQQIADIDQQLKNQRAPANQKTVETATQPENNTGDARSSGTHISNTSERLQHIKQHLQKSQQP